MSIVVFPSMTPGLGVSLLSTIDREISSFPPSWIQSVDPVRGANPATFRLDISSSFFSPTIKGIFNMFSKVNVYLASKPTMQITAVRGSIEICDSQSLTGRHNQWTKRFDSFY